MNCGATKHTEQRYKYAVDWLRYCLLGALYRLLYWVRSVKLSLQLMPGYSVGYAVPWWEPIKIVHSYIVKSSVIIG